MSSTEGLCVQDLDKVSRGPTGSLLLGTAVPEGMEVKSNRQGLPKNVSNTSLDLLPFGVDNLRIDHISDVTPPAALCTAMPLTEPGRATVISTRTIIRNILDDLDDRVLVVVGPCSVHDPAAALEYAARLLPVKRELEQDIVIVMRVYFEKPRTIVGWKGLINDPHLDNSCDINTGLQAARRLLVTLADQGMPCGIEFLDCLSPQYFSDTISWGAIGARTVESQLHRELASGLSMPIGFKNGTGGNTDVVVEALQAARHRHCFLSVTKQGSVAIVKTQGNSDCHIVLRGGATGPNYYPNSVRSTVAAATMAGVRSKVLIDCSHGNSMKIYQNQEKVCDCICEQLAVDDETATNILGAMIESNLVEGRQAYEPGVSARSSLVYGMSITDGCLSFENTVGLLQQLAAACRTRRANRIRRTGRSDI